MRTWIPAFAGMTSIGLLYSARHAREGGHPGHVYQPKCRCSGKEKWIVILSINPLIDRVFGKPSAALSEFQVKMYGNDNTKINKGF